jgi:hypothetical protein
MGRRIESVVRVAIRLHWFPFVVIRLHAYSCFLMRLHA